MYDIKEVGLVEARAITRFVRLSPRKARLVADLVRGKSALEALDILELSLIHISEPTRPY